MADLKRPLGSKLYYSIGEVAELTDLAPYTLRAWEKEFPCLRPKRVRGKNRAYRAREIGIILLIKRLLQDERYTMRGVQQKLRNDPELVRGAGQSLAGLGGEGDPAGDAPQEPLADDGAGPSQDLPLLREVAGELRRILELLR